VRSLELVEGWPAETVAISVVTSAGSVVGRHGPQGREFRLASVTKLLTAYAVLIAVEEGAIEWDQPAGPAGSTVRHLAAHASGLAFDEDRPMSEPGERRIYSNTGFEVLAATVAEATAMPFERYLTEGVLQPLRMLATELRGSAGAGAFSTAADLTRFAAELQRPTLVAPETLIEATTVAFPGLGGVLPGYGNQRPNDWGLGFEIRDGKRPHWTGVHSSGATFGHFGQSGTFLWVDPVAGTACVCLTDLDFGEWALARWPELTDAVLDELKGQRA
jgi:CubicO group peptidase (beta-lactamase class C family)